MPTKTTNIAHTQALLPPRSLSDTLWRAVFTYLHSQGLLTRTAKSVNGKDYILRGSTPHIPKSARQTPQVPWSTIFTSSIGSGRSSSQSNNRLGRGFDGGMVPEGEPDPRAIGFRELNRILWRLVEWCCKNVEGFQNVYAYAYKRERGLEMVPTAVWRELFREARKGKGGRY